MAYHQYIDYDDPADQDLREDDRYYVDRRRDYRNVNSAAFMDMPLDRYVSARDARHPIRQNVARRYNQYEKGSRGLKRIIEEEMRHKSRNVDVRVIRNPPRRNTQKIVIIKKIYTNGSKVEKKNNNNFKKPQPSKKHQKKGNNKNTSRKPTIEELNRELDEYMNSAKKGKSSKELLDAELDEYMSYA
ncbi:unnamed protein product [Bursaphelenchus okinawaensis]|uniref:Chromatin target of PRMT1 protein C-terminal domain-containing protein n=1 Tax=Bursaphelenchus okinawaensis TaxID=465554 RepID=A0A811JR60_9BILA|nr:unnamed protein product [Bursaphelenchus okinawaensis]CAG9079730.1 unnamed protein product [Bursaphelenchus okinawaensis]